MQLGLFGSADTPDFTKERELARRLPAEVHLGTSSWTFPGWETILYPTGTTLAQLRKRGLQLYSANPLLRTVGIGSSYYRPLSSATLTRYAEQLPNGFRCVSSPLTLRGIAEQWTTRHAAGGPSPPPSL